MSQTMTSNTVPDEQKLDQLLQSLVTEFSYSQVLDHLVQVGGRLQRPMPSATYLMTLTPEEREPFLKAAVDEALPLYLADLAKPEAERVLTADLASDFLEEFPEEEEDGASNV